MIRTLCTVGIFLTLPLGMRGQAAKANPVSDTAREILRDTSKTIIAAAEQMPADKYGFHPTDGQMSFGKIIAHVTEASNQVCAMISDTPTPPTKVTDADPKASLVAAIKASFDYCTRSLAGLRDSKMGDQITFFDGEKVVRARAVFELTNDLNDHYAQLAGYMRGVGLLPPTAQPQGK